MTGMALGSMINRPVVYTESQAPVEMVAPAPVAAPSNWSGLDMLLCIAIIVVAILGAAWALSELD